MWEVIVPSINPKTFEEVQKPLGVHTFRQASSSNETNAIIK